MFRETHGATRERTRYSRETAASSEAAKPIKVEIPTMPPPLWKASGNRVSATTVNIAPAAIPSMNGERRGRRFTKGHRTTKAEEAEISTIPVHIAITLPVAIPCSRMPGRARQGFGKVQTNTPRSRTTHHGIMQDARADD